MSNNLVMGGGIKILLLLGVLAVFLALVVGAVLLILWWTRRNKSSSAPPKISSPLPESPSNSPKRSCPQCGKELPANAPEGLCPACVMRIGIGSQTGSGTIVLPTTPPPPPEIAKHFPQLEIIELLGQGGMGMVYKARQKNLDRVVALKILRMDTGRDPAFAERFSREAKALARLNHQNIVTVHDFGETDGFYFLLMEFVDGANLREVIRGQKIKPEDALKIVPPICEALQFAHEQGIVHRDIKPENILVDKQGRVKIADFGIAKILGGEKPTQPLTGVQQAIGTPHYMAPEQVEKPTTVDHRADIYSLGVVFYEMLTGELPLGRFAPPSQKVQIDVRLDEIVLRALEKEPERRYQTAGEIKTQVETVATTPAGSSAQPPSQAPQDPQWIIWEHRAPGWRVRCRKCGFIEHWGKYGIRKGAVGTTSKFGRCQNCRKFGWNVIGRGPVPKNPVAGSEKISSAELTDLLAARPARLSRAAIIGTVWASFFFLAGLLFFMTRMVPSNGPAEPARWEILFSLTLLPLGATAPFGTTILGWIAVGKIRRSAGRLHGLGLAVFDGLLFPLLALDVVINILGAGLYQIWGSFARDTAQAQYRDGILLIVDGLIIIAIITVDFLIARAVWRAVNKPLDGSPASSPDQQSQPKERESANTPTGYTAMFFAGLSGVLGGLSFFLMPNTPPVLVWAILIAALLGIFLGIRACQTWLGKGAITAGGINVAIWLIVAAVVCFKQFVPPFGPPARAEIHEQVFEIDPALADKLVPTISRHSATNGHWQVAEISSQTLNALLENVAPKPGVLIDQHRTFSFWPRSADSGSYSRAESQPRISGGGGIGGFFGARRRNGFLEGRIDYNIHHNINTKRGLSEMIFYEGKLPQAGAIIFLIPFSRNDGTKLNLVVAFEEISRRTTTDFSPQQKTAFQKMSSSSEFSFSKVDRYAVTWGRDADYAFDFERGQLTGGVGSDPRQVAAAGNDVFHHPSDGWLGLDMFLMRLGKIPDLDQAGQIDVWQASADDFADLLIASGTKKMQRERVLHLEPAPASYAFCTREGMIGLMQIILSNNGEAEVRSKTLICSGAPRADGKSKTSTKPSVTLLAVENHVLTGMQMWKPDGSKVSDDVRAALTNNWRSSSPGVLWFSVLVSNASNEQPLTWLAKVGRREITPYINKMEKSETLGGTLVRFAGFDLAKKDSVNVRFGFAVRPPRTLFVWEGNPWKLTENNWPGSPKIEDIEVESFEPKPIRDFDPLRGYTMKTNAGSRIVIKVPNKELHATWILEVTDQQNRRHIFRAGNWITDSNGHVFGDVGWDVDLTPKEILSIKLKGHFVDQDYQWVTFEDVALRPVAGEKKPSADIISPGEDLEIHVADDASFDGRYSVRQGGYINMKSVGRILVAGKTAQEAAVKIAKALQTTNSVTATIHTDVKGGILYSKTNAVPTE